jgi:dimethylaniline monooxygenase (N-oxide forming)
MVQYADFWETIAKNVTIIRADIEKLQYHEIILADGSSVGADAIMLGTGYEQRLHFFSDEDCIALGLPHEKIIEPLHKIMEWDHLEAVAEKEILKLYPAIRSNCRIPKDVGDINLKLAPFRLYHGIAPLNADRSIAFVGFPIWVNMFESAEITALWAVAYLDGKLKLPSTEDMRKDVAYTTTYLRLRVPTYGSLGNFYMYDRFAHQKQLLQHDLGLKSWHSNNWLVTWLRPRFPSSLKGIKKEYLNKYEYKDAGKANGTVKTGTKSRLSTVMSALVTRTPKRVFEICDLDMYVLNHAISNLDQ